MDTVIIVIIVIVIIVIVIIVINITDIIVIVIGIIVDITDYQNTDIRVEILYKDIIRNPGTSWMETGKWLEKEVGVKNVDWFSFITLSSSDMVTRISRITNFKREEDKVKFILRWV